MPQSAIPPYLIPSLVSPHSSCDQVTDALEEWISNRRTKGDTLFEVSVGLAELEDRTPPNLSAAFHRARYVTNVPQPSDLTPPMGPFPLARSASPSTILSHLLSQPVPTLEHSREVILEYVLAREGKLREKKPGRGGRGTLGQDGFEDIGKRLGEVEDGLRGGSITSPRGTALNSTTQNGSDDFGQSQQTGLTLILSLRMSLAYFSLHELANQLLLLAIADAERIIVQHIRRRVQGEGRWGVGKELESIETLILPKRPALRPAFRSAKIRTSFPSRPCYAIPLPSPSKSGCIKLLTAFAKDVDAAKGSSPSLRSQVGTSLNGSISQLAPPVISRDLPDPNPLASYALELVSEFLTREKREYMLKGKWAKSGRDQLSKDLGEVEAGLCITGRNNTSTHAPILLPIFLLLRRTYALPPSPLPSSMIDPYLDILPVPPDPDDVPFREPTVQSTTATLYVNPRLDDAAALGVIEELVENEREQIGITGGTREEATKWITGLIESVEKRFPDGSYASVFAVVKNRVTNHSISSQAPDLWSGPSDPVTRTPSWHRRVHLTVQVPTSLPPVAVFPSQDASRQEHKRSISMPMSRNTDDESDDDTTEEDSGLAQQSRPIVSSTPQLPPLDLINPIVFSEKELFRPSSPAGWWDVVSPLDNDTPAPWHEDSDMTASKRRSSTSAPQGPALSPGAESARVPSLESTYAEVSKVDNHPPTSPRPPSSRSPPYSREIILLATPGRESRLPGRDTPTGSPGQLVTARLAPIPDTVDLDDEHSPLTSSRLFPYKTSRPNLPSEYSSDGAASRISPPPSTSRSSSANSTATKLKLGGFGRSVSLAMNRSKKEDKDNDKEKLIAGKKVMNSPGRWNREMVANIMGPPADRR